MSVKVNGWGVLSQIISIVMVERLSYDRDLPKGGGHDVMMMIVRVVVIMVRVVVMMVRLVVMMIILVIYIVSKMVT